MRVLIIDSDENYLNSMKKELEDICEEIIIERNFFTALKITKYKLVDVIICDCYRSIIENIKCIDHQQKKTNVIIHSNLLDFTCKKIAIQHGIYSYYCKPSYDMIINDILLIKNGIHFKK